jgi:putative peptide zinc metalloprotease protein
MQAANPLWTAIAPLRLRLAPQVGFSRQVIRGEVWYILRDPLSGRHFRVTSEAHMILELLDGSRTFEQVYRLAEGRLAQQTPPEQEVLDLLLQLHGTDLLRGMPLRDSRELAARAAAARHTRIMRNLKSLLAIRVPLINPDRFLDRTRGIGRALFSPIGFAAWLLIVGWALFEVGANWGELTGNVAERVLATDNLLLLTLAFVISKLVHEFGHGFAVKRWRGEVNEMGITLLVFMPVPYVEASSSATFHSKWQRIAVGAAGMYVELLLAAGAMFAWLHLEPGLLRTLAFNTMVVASVSTVVINANPLLRYDGYFILADLIEIPNLAPRSYRYLGDLVQRYLFGVRGRSPVVAADGEKSWLVVYAIASYLCRMFVIAMIALFLASQFLVVGVLLAIWLCATSIVMPLYKGAAFVLASPKLEGHRGRAIMVTGLGLASLAALLFVLPAPMATRAEGVVWAPPGSEIATEADGFVKQVLANDGDAICAGCKVLALENPELPTSLALLEARLTALNARYLAERSTDLVKSQITQQEIEHIQERLTHERDRLGKLMLAAPRDGRFTIPEANDLVGRYMARGTIVGYVYRREELLIRVVVRQEDMGLIREGVSRVSIRLPGNVDQELHGAIERTIPSATDRLPSLALSAAAGGGASVEPQATGGPKAVQRYFELHIAVTGSSRPEWFGQRAYVQFVHRDEPIGLQWWRRLRQLFLRELSV